jgi:hypothetical protein
MKSYLRELLLGLGVVALTTLLFSPVFPGEFLNWDDDTLLVNNPFFRGLDAEHWQWMCSTMLLGHWQPLTWLSYAFDYLLWGMSPTGWHAVNLLLHGCNAGLVFLLCRWFLKRNPDPVAGAGKCGTAAALAALFWSLHPLRVEAVAWLATRGYLLCTLFCLLTVLFYLRAVERGRFSLAALLCFIAATASKGIGMMLPLVLLLLDVVPLHRITSFRTLAFRTLEKAPFFALSLATGLVAFWAKKTQGGMVAVEQYGWVERCGQALHGIWFYLAKMVLPLDLSPLYYRTPGPAAILGALLLTAGAFTGLFLFRRRLRPVAVASCAFALLMMPMLGFTQSGAQVAADRFTLLAAVPFSVLLSAGLYRLRRLRKTVQTALAFLLLTYSAQTAVLSWDWSNSLTLWNRAVSIDGENARAWNLLGVALLNRHLPGKAAWTALGEYERALRDVDYGLAIDSVTGLDRVKMMIARAQIAERLGRTTEAFADYTAVAEQLAPDSVWRARALQSRARLHLLMGNLDAAAADFRAAAAVPEFEKRGQCEAALEQIKKLPGR